MRQFEVDTDYENFPVLIKTGFEQEFRKVGFIYYGLQIW